MLFSPDPNQKTYWVRSVLHVREPDNSSYRRIEISIRLAYSEGFLDPDGTFIPGGYAIIDYRAPHTPFINWAWIDAHQKEIFQSLELGD